MINKAKIKWYLAIIKNQIPYIYNKYFNSNKYMLIFWILRVVFIWIGWIILYNIFIK